MTYIQLLSQGRVISGANVRTRATTDAGLWRAAEAAYMGTGAHLSGYQLDSIEIDGRRINRPA